MEARKKASRKKTAARGTARKATTPKQPPATAPYKFVVQAVLHTLGSDGKPTGEIVCDPNVIYGLDGLRKWTRNFPHQMKRAAAEAHQAGIL